MDIDKIKRQLGIRFKELRLSKGLKQEDLEQIVGVLLQVLRQDRKGVGEPHAGYPDTAVQHI